ncbi:MAG: hypothetical protein ACI4OT_04815 [Bacilli bacterium]
MKNKEKEIYLEQKSNTFLCLVICLILIIGMTFKTFYNNESIEMLIILIIPILFLNATFFTLINILKNTFIEKTVFNLKNKRQINNLTYILMIFILSIILIIYKDTTAINNLYCLVLIGINFLYSSLIIKKIFDYEMENKK